MKITFSDLSKQKRIKKGTITEFDTYVREVTVTKEGWFRKTTTERMRIVSGSRGIPWRYVSTNKYVEDNDQIEAMILSNIVEEALSERAE